MAEVKQHRSCGSYELATRVTLRTNKLQRRSTVRTTACLCPKQWWKQQETWKCVRGNLRLPQPQRTNSRLLGNTRNGRNNLAQRIAHQLVISNLSAQKVYMQVTFYGVWLNRLYFVFRNTQTHRHRQTYRHTDKHTDTHAAITKEKRP